MVYSRQDTKMFDISNSFSAVYRGVYNKHVVYILYTLLILDISRLRVVVQCEIFNKLLAVYTKHSKRGLRCNCLAIVFKLRDRSGLF